MSDNLLQSRTGALVLGAGALALAGLAYLLMNKREQHVVEKVLFGDKFDAKLHNLERLNDLVEDYYFEIVQNYLQICLLLHALKVQGKFKPEILESIKTKVQGLNQAKKGVVCKQAGLSCEEFDRWI